MNVETMRTPKQLSREYGTSVIERVAAKLKGEQAKTIGIIG